MPGFIAVLKNRTVPICENAQLHDDFLNGGNKLIPMIHAHGGGAPADEHMAIPM